MALTTDQLQAIDRHLRKDNWLLNEGLITELTDHYITGIEDRLAQGLSFEAGITAIHHGFGGRKGLLKMEEDYQMQKHRAIGRIEWQTIQSFVEGPRWPITLGIFGLLYGLNAYLGYTDAISTGLFVGQFYVTVSVLTSGCLSLWFFYQSRKEVNAAVNYPTSTIYLTLYCFGLALLLLNKYGLTRYGISLSSSVLIAVDTLLETLCAVYYVATWVSVKKLLGSKRLKKA